MLDHEESIHRLQQSTQSVLSALKDIVKVQFEREDLDMLIVEEIKSINPDWDEETLMAFDVTEVEKDKIHTFYDSFERLRKEVILHQDCLASHQTMKAEK